MSAIAVLLQEVARRVDHLKVRFDMLDGRMVRVEERLDRVEARLEGVESRLDGVETRLTGLETDVRQLIVRVDGVERQLGDLVVVVSAQGKRLDRFEGRWGNVEGTILEERYHRNAGEWLGAWIRKSRQITSYQLGDLSEDQRCEVAAGDLLFIGERPDGHSVVLAAEISTTVEGEDVARAATRVRTLEGAGYAVVAGYRITDEAAAEAERLGVGVDLRRPAA